MNNVILHIRFLLRKQSCVIMPGLGALIATEQSATLCEEWGTVQAPQRDICFNAAIVNNDGLIATSIARREQISYDAACKLMAHGISEIKHQLEIGCEVEIPRIGILSRSNDGRIRFTPALTATQQSAALGYISAPLPSRKHTNENTEEKQDPRYYYMRISRYALRLTAAIALPVIASLSILLYTLAATDNSMTTVDSRMDYASVLPMPQTQQNTIPTKKVQMSTDKALGTLVVATFCSKQHAELYMQRHSTSAFCTSMQQTDHGTWQVSAGGVRTRSALQQMLHNTSFIVEYPGAWIKMEEQE